MQDMDVELSKSYLISTSRYQLYNRRSKIEDE
jgi:hypothetical protein